MTTTDTDPRTDLAGWLGLAPAQADYAKRFARTNTALGKLGARLIAQDQADTPDPEPDDGLIAVTVHLTAEEFEATRAIHPNSFGTSDHGRSVRKLTEACRDLPAPKPPWTSPLPNLPDLTEAQCLGAVLAAEGYPDSDMPWPQIGRALKAAGWTPEEEA